MEALFAFGGGGNTELVDTLVVLCTIRLACTRLFLLGPLAREENESEKKNGGDVMLEGVSGKHTLLLSFSCWLYVVRRRNISSFFP